MKKKNNTLWEERIYIPSGKALIPVIVDALNGCKGCYKEGKKCLHIACVAGEREDNKHVILKLVDY